MAKGMELVKYEAPVMSDQGALLELCGGDRVLAWFLSEWINNGKNAIEAYMTIRPGVTRQSARALGAKMLARINTVDLMAYYGVGVQDYFNQLQAGMNADKVAVLRKYDKHGNVIQEIDMSQPDHKTRRAYHEAAGKILGIEKERNSPPVAIQFNFNELQTTIKKEREMRGLPV